MSVQARCFAPTRPPICSLPPSNPPARYTHDMPTVSLPLSFRDSFWSQVRPLLRLWKRAQRTEGDGLLLSPSSFLHPPPLLGSLFPFVPLSGLPIRPRGPLLQARAGAVSLFPSPLLSTWPESDDPFPRSVPLAVPSQGVEENDQVLAFLSHQALATKEHALKVLNAPAVGGGKKPRGFDRDEGVSLVFAFRGLEGPCSLLALGLLLSFLGGTC